jgi:hypothetical protein
MVVASAGFALTAAFAVHQQWRLPELCWSFWLAGLGYCWAFVLAGGVRILLLPAGVMPAGIAPWSVLVGRPALWRAVVGVAALVLSAVLGYGYAWLFGFYGLFLSVFAEMEPLALFGRNGFINSDFFTPVLHLLDRYWPLVLGAVLTDLHLAWQGPAWRVPFKPFSTQLILIHVMVLGVPFVSLLFWWLVGDRYHGPAVVLVLALFYFAPRKEPPVRAVETQGA